MHQLQRNSQFRAKNLGTISSLNDYIAFRAAHGIDDKKYKDLYLGDFFTVNDGTYNTQWMVAHFDYYALYDESTRQINRTGVLLIPVTTLDVQTKMSDTDASGGYKDSIVNTTVCPAVGAAMQRVFGSYLMSIASFMTTTVNSALPSMAGQGTYGASTNCEWVTSLSVLPTVSSIGSSGVSSSFSDHYDMTLKMAVFNYYNFVRHTRRYIWLRDVSSINTFAVISGAGGGTTPGRCNTEYYIRPVIYIT